MARPTVRTISRYLLRQHCAPLGFALAALTSLMLLNQIAKQFGSLVGKGLPWSVIIEVFVLSIPFIVAVTLPMAVLVAVLHVFTRLAGDNEITALQASGVSVGRVITPVLGGAAVVALLSFLWNDQVLPRSNHRLRTLQVDIQRKKPSFTLKEQVKRGRARAVLPAGCAYRPQFQQTQGCDDLRPGRRGAPTDHQRRLGSHGIYPRRTRFVPHPAGWRHPGGEPDRSHPGRPHLLPHQPDAGRRHRQHAGAHRARQLQERPRDVDLRDARHGGPGAPRSGAGGCRCRRRRAERLAPARGPRPGVPRPAALCGRHGARRPVLPRVAAGGGLVRSEDGRGADTQTTSGAAPPPTATPH